MILGMVAIAASTLFVSCAKKHEIDPVPAFPRERAATYKLNTKGVYAWSAASADQWTSGNKWTGFRTSTVPAEISALGNAILFYMAPNKSWTATIAEESQEYIQFRVFKGGDRYDEANWELVNKVSGERDNQVELCFVVVNAPEFGENEVETFANLTMAGQTMTLAKIIIGPKAEPKNEEDEE